MRFSVGFKNCSICMVSMILWHSKCVIVVFIFFYQLDCRKYFKVNMSFQGSLRRLASPVHHLAFIKRHLGWYLRLFSVTVLWKRICHLTFLPFPYWLMSMSVFLGCFSRLWHDVLLCEIFKCTSLLNQRVWQQSSLGVAMKTELNFPNSA